MPEAAQALGLVPRPEPLAIAGVAVRGAAAVALARQLLARPDDARRLSAVASGDRIVVTGDEIPWVDGATWLGREPEAPLLLVPTRLAVTPRAGLAWRAIERVHGARGPVALLPEGDRLALIALGGGRIPGGEPLAAFLARWGGA